MLEEDRLFNTLALLFGIAHVFAGSGLGRLLAQRFARLGSTLILWDVNAAGNEETARLVKKLGATAHAYTCDISQRNQVYDAAEKVPPSPLHVHRK